MTAKTPAPAQAEAASDESDGQSESGSGSESSEVSPAERKSVRASFLADLQNLKAAKPVSKVERASRKAAELGIIPTGGELAGGGGGKRSKPDAAKAASGEESQNFGDEEGQRRPRPP